MIHIIITSLVLTSLASLMAGIFVLYKRGFKLHTGFFAAYFIGFAIWAGGLALNRILYLLDPATATFTIGSQYYFIQQIIFLCPIILLTGKLWFALTYPDDRMPSWKAGWAYLLAGFSAFMAFMVFRDGAFFTSITITPHGYANLDTGPYTPYMSIFVLLHYIVTAIVLGYKLSTTKGKTVLRGQLRLLVWSHVVAVTLAALANWILPVYFQIPYFSPWGPVASFISLGAFAYAVTHYRLLNLRLSLAIFFAYFTTLVILAGYVFVVFLNTATLAPTQLLLINTGSALVMLALFFPLHKFSKRVCNYLFYGSFKNTHERLRDLADSVGSSRDFGAAAQNTLTGLQKLLGLQDCRFIPAHQLASMGNDMTQYMHRHTGKAIYLEELTARAEMEQDTTAGRLADTMRQQGVAVLQPVHDEYSNEHIGAIATGEKKTGGMFTDDELSSLELIGRRSALCFGQTHSGADHHIESDYAEATSVVNNALSNALLTVPRLEAELEKIPAKRGRKKTAKDGESQTVIDLQNMHPREMLSAITRNMGISYRSMQHIQLLRDLAMVDPHLIREQTDIRATIDNIVEFKTLDTTLAHMGISTPPRVTIQQHTSDDTCVLAHGYYLEHVITELLMNAALYGDAPIILRTEEADETVTISVTSSGSLTNDQIMRALQRSRAGIHEREGGGYGLTVAKAFTEATGGHFAFSSRGKKVIAEIILHKVTD